MATRAALAAALPAPFTLAWFDQLDSTNEEARRRVESGQAAPALIVAEQQSAGRGRRGRAWTSPAGNIYATLLQELHVRARYASDYGFILSLAIAEAVAALVPGKTVNVKWPNDVLLDGAKLAGILLEIFHAPDGQAWLVGGFGVNLASHPGDTPYMATSVAMYVSDINVEGMLGAIMQRYFTLTGMYEAAGFAPIRDAWLDRALGRGQKITVRLPDGGSATGVFNDLSEAGSLVLQLADGTMPEISAGDVFFAERVQGAA